DRATPPARGVAEMREHETPRHLALPEARELDRGSVAPEHEDPSALAIGDEEMAARRDADGGGNRPAKHELRRWFDHLLLGGWFHHPPLGRGGPSHEPAPAWAASP